MKHIFSILLIFIITSCGNDQNPNENTIAVDARALQKITKYQPGDPFVETMKKSEFFEVSGLSDNVIETKSGTIVSIPKGAFRNANGDIIEKEIKVEITDINSLEEQFNANINSPAGQDIVLNGGALYINATAGGAQLAINEASPIFVELLEDPAPDLMVFEGIRNEKGEMQWINPKQPKKHLVPVDLSELDFLPPGFYDEVNKNMPFRNYKEPNGKLVDSLYYLLNNKQGAAPSERNGLFDKVRTRVKNGLKLDMFHSSGAYHDGYGVQQVQHASDGAAAAGCPTIKPASIKAIKRKKFEKTFIATKQFEERMATIHQARKQEVLEIYINNLGKDLSYCDSLASTLFANGTTYQLKFLAFSKENWTNVKNLPDSVKKLGKYYSSQLNKIENKLLSTKKKYEKQLAKKSEKAAEVRAEYKEILVKRQNYRRKKFGFKMTNLGWKASGKKCEPLEMKIKVNKGDQYDRVHVYTFDPSINSIFAWRSNNKIDFKYAFPQDAVLIFEKYQKAKALVVAYKKDEPYFDLQNFTAAGKVDIKFNLNSTTKKGLNKLLSDMDRGSKSFNKLKVDLEYQTAFHNEKIRLKKLQEERIVISNLYRFVYRCNVQGRHKGGDLMTE